MGTQSNIPFSNNGGNNQFSPAVGVGSIPSPIVSTGTPGMGVGNIPNNPYSPIPTGTAPTSAPTSGTQNPIAAPTNPLQSGSGGYSGNVQPIVPGGTASNNLQTQLTDIYGQGTGASLFNLINNMSGTDSTVLQEYIQSLAPSFAQSSATLKAGLGASGVSGNSSVAALGESNLQSQENADISGESANLTMNQQQLTAQILESTEGASAQQTASSGWDILGTVLSQGAGDIGAIFGGNGPASLNSGSSGVSSGNFNELMNEGTVLPSSLDPSSNTVSPIAI